MTPPPGSKITYELLSSGESKFSWKNPDGGLMRYFIAAFLTFWMGGWVFGFKFGAGEVFNQNANTPKPFMIIWLVGWTIGGIGALFVLFNLLRPTKPASIILGASGFKFDSGTSSPLYKMQQFNNPENIKNPLKPWKEFFKGRKQIEIKDLNLLEFKLDQNPARLYFDQNSERIILGEGLSEPDIEWLYHSIQSLK